MQCSVNCPYRNQYDVCEIAMRRVARMRTCAQLETRRAVKRSKHDPRPESEVRGHGCR